MPECAGNFPPRSCAGADRLSSGMRGAFGKPYGTAARVDIGQVLISLRTKERLVKWSLGNDGDAGCTPWYFFSFFMIVYCIFCYISVDVVILQVDLGSVEVWARSIRRKLFLHI